MTKTVHGRRCRLRNDPALQEARRTDDSDQSRVLYATVWSEWATNLPYLWIYHTHLVLLSRDQVRDLDTFTYPDGQPPAAMDWGAVYLTDVWLEDR